MLHFGEQDFVAGFDMSGAPRLGNEVDALCRAAGKDNFIGAASVDVLSGASAGSFESGGGAIAELMDATVNVGVIVRIIVCERLQHLAWFLSSSGVIKI